MRDTGAAGHKIKKEKVKEKMTGMLSRDFLSDDNKLVDWIQSKPEEAQSRIGDAAS